MENKKQNISTGLNINWYPGHMKKGMDQLIQISKSIDLVIQVVDARAIYSTSNKDILNVFHNKPILTIALKSDYSTVKADSNILLGTIKDPKFKKVIIQTLYQIFNSKISNLKNKGLVNPKFTLLVVGLPNVGKSSLINYLKNKNVLPAKNQPGVTKKQTTVVINDNFNLIDTPGILFKKIEDIHTAYKLTLINCIKKEILVLDDVLRFAFNYYTLHHSKEFFSFYKLDHITEYDLFQKAICLKRGWILKNNELDLNKFETHFFNDISDAKICKVNYDLAK